MRIIWDSHWYIFVLCVLAGLAAAAFLYRSKRSSELSAPLRWSMAALRFLSVSLVCFLLASVLLRQVHNETQEPVVLIALDNSSSMLAGKDSSYVRAKLEEDLNSLENTIADRYDVTRLYFDSEVSADRPKQLFTGKETDFDQLLKTVANDFANQNVGALVVVSDGIYNKGSNPVHAASALGFPVYGLGVGDTSEQTDLLIRRVDHNQIAYLGNNFPVVVQVAAKKAAGREVTVQLLQGDKVKGSFSTKITSDNFSVPATFTLNAASPGIQKFTARIISGGGQQNVQNDQQEFVVEVLDNKEKILLLADAPHPDIAAIRTAISGNTSYALNFRLLHEQLPPLQEFNLVIIHGYGPGSAHIVQQCRSLRIPFWIVNPASPADLPGVKIATGLNRYNEVETFVDETFGFFSLSTELRAFLSEVPALTTFFGNYQLPQGSAPLLLQRLGPVETNNPVLYFNATDDTRYGVFIGEGLWKWKMRDYAMHGSSRIFAELISKSIQYLAAREDKSYFRLTSPRIITDNEVLEMSAELYNKSYEPVNTTDVMLTLVNDQKQKYNYTFSKTGKAYRLNAGTLPAGEYQYRASTVLGGETFVKSGQIAVKKTFAEQVNVVADHAVLRQMAARSGADFFTKEQLDSLRTGLSAEGRLKTIIYSQTVTSPLIDEKILFFILLLILTIEWFLRKRYLLI